MTSGKDKVVGIQIGSISFVDEGVDQVLDTLRERVGVNVLFIGTVSWLGLKIGRSISWELDGWPDHGISEPIDLRGGSFLKHRPEYYRNTFISNFRAPDEAMKGKDILEMVIPGARKRGMKVIPELMEPLFKYAGHGSANTVPIPNLPQCLEVDHLGRIGSEPCLENPAYRNWWYSMIEDHCRNYDIDGMMWCNERRSPLDNLISGMAPTCYCKHCVESLRADDIDVERTRIACGRLHEFFQRARSGKKFVEGAFIEFLRVLLEFPEILLLEKHWIKRNKDLDRELYGVTKWCDPNLEFGLNVWNRNHFNPIRKGSVAVVGGRGLCRLGEAHYIPTSIGTDLCEGNDGVSQEYSSRLYSAGTNAIDAKNARPRRGGMERSRRKGNGSKKLRRRPMSRHGGGPRR